MRLALALVVLLLVTPMVAARAPAPPPAPPLFVPVELAPFAPAWIVPAPRLPDQHFGAALDAQGGLLAVGSAAGAASWNTVYLFQRARGATTWTQVGDAILQGYATNAMDVALANGGDIVVSGNPLSVQAHPVVVGLVNGDLQVTQDLSPPPLDPACEPAWGGSVDASAGRLLVGDPNACGGVKARLFTPIGGHHYAVAGDLVASLDVGQSVALSGSVAALAGRAGGSGAIVVLREGAVGWAQEATLVAPGTTSAFGRALALQGDVLVAGDPLAPPMVDGGYGRAFVFERANGAWSLVATLAPGQDCPGQQFGRAVAIDPSGGAIAVGRGGCGSTHGGASVYVRTPAGWTLERDVAPARGCDGTAVALQTWLFVSAPCAGDSTEGGVVAYQGV